VIAGLTGFCVLAAGSLSRGVSRITCRADLPRYPAASFNRSSRMKAAIL
jgi:hypothetical protein